MSKEKIDTNKCYICNLNNDCELWIGCNTCKRWFHSTCLKTKKFPRFWSCSFCIENKKKVKESIGPLIIDNPEMTNEEWARLFADATEELVKEEKEKEAKLDGKSKKRKSKKRKSKKRNFI